MGPFRFRSTSPLALAALLGALLALPAPARAQGNIQVGPFRLLPSLDVAGEYNDNILLSPRDEIDDFIWTISPGITVELPGRRSSLRVGYRADIKEYVENDELDTVDHTGQFEGRLTLGVGLELRLTDEFRRAQDFPGDPVPEINQLVELNQNTLSFGADYRLSERFSLGGEYRWFLLDYDSGPEFDQFDHSEHRFAGTLYYRFLPKTSVLGEYRYEMIRYEQDAVANDRDSDGHAILVGLKGDLTAKTSLQIKGGWQWRDYENDARDDFDGFIVEGEAIWKYAEPSQLRLFVGRAAVESLYEGNNYYTTTYGGAELRHYLTPVVILRARGMVGVNEYPDPTVDPSSGQLKDRSDNFYEVAVGVQYQIRRWLAVALDYQFLERTSNFDDFEYTQNRVWATVKLQY
jgi:hypothetical protein